jgi:hypothetical protein
MFLDNSIHAAPYWAERLLAVWGIGQAGPVTGFRTVSIVQIELGTDTLYKNYG